MVSSQLEVNDAVSVDEKLTGIVQYIKDDVVGVHLVGKSSGKGDCDGTLEGTRHFSCKSQCGMFVSSARITKRKSSRRERILMKREMSKETQTKKLEPIKEKLSEDSNEICIDSNMRLNTMSSCTDGSVASAYDEMKQEHDKQQKALIEAELINSKLKADISALEEHNEVLKTRIEQQEINRIEEQEEQDRYAATDQGSDSEVLEKALAEAEARNQSLKAHVEHLKTISAVDPEKLEMKLQDIISLQKTLNDSEKVNSQLKVDKSAVEAQNESLKARVEQLISVSAVEMKQIKQIYGESKEAFDALTKQKIAGEQRHAEEIQKLKKLLQESESMNSDDVLEQQSSQDSDVSQGNVSFLKKKLKTSVLINNKLKTTNSTLEAQNKAFKARIEDVKAKEESLSALQKSLANAEARANQVESASTKEREELNKMLAEAAALVEEVQSTSAAEIKELKRLNDDSQKKFDHYDKAMKGLAKDNLAKQKRIDSLQKSLVEAGSSADEEEILRLTQESLQKQRRIASLENSLALAETRVEEVESNSFTELQGLQALYAASQKAFEELKQERAVEEATYEEEIQKLAEDSEEIQDSITSLEAALEEAELVNSNLKADNVSLEDKNKLLQGIIDTVQSNSSKEVKRLKVLHTDSRKAFDDLKQEMVAEKLMYEEEIQSLTQANEEKLESINSLKRSFDEVESINSKLRSSLQARDEREANSTSEEIKKLKEVNDVSQKAIVDFLQEREELDNEIEKLTQDCEAKQEKIASLQKSLAQVESKLEVETEFRLESAKSERDDSAQLHKLTQDLATLRETNEQLKNELLELKQEQKLTAGPDVGEFERFTKECAMLKENLTQKQNLIEELQKTKHNEEKKEIQQLLDNTGSIQSRNDDVDELQEQAKDQKKKASLLQNEVANLKEKAQEKKATVQSFTAELEALVNPHEEEILRLTKESEAKEENINSLQRALAEAEKVNSELKSANSSLVSKTATNTTTTAVNDDQVQVLQEKVESLSSEIEDLSNVDKELSQAKLLIVHKGYEIENLEGKLKLEKTRVVSLQEKVADLTAEVEDASKTGGNLDQARVLIANKEHRINDLEHELTLQNQKIFYLQDQVDSLKEEIEDFEKTNGQLSLAREMLAKKSHRVDDLENTNLQQRMKIVGLSDELKAVKEELEIKTGKVDSISKMKNRQLKELEDRLLETRWVIREKDTTIKDLLEGTQKIKKELYDVRAELCLMAQAKANPIILETEQEEE